MKEKMKNIDYQEIIRKYLLLWISLCLVIVYIFIQMSPLVKERTGNAPEITFDKTSLDISVKTKENKLLEGVKATDVEDGDLTKDVMIENLSAFNSSDHSRTVTYVVFDSEDHVARATRTVHYKDYTAPVFSMSDQMVSDTYSTKTLLSKMSAKSCVDGDISKNITVMNTSLVESKLLKVKLSVTDSTNTTSYLNINYYLDAEKDIDIQLKKYLVYVEKGSTFKYRDNIKNVVEKMNRDNSLISYINIDLPDDIDEPGVHEVVYTLERSNGNVGKTIMNVVVTGKED